MGIPLLTNHDEVDLRLSCTEKPFATNGVWDETAKRVSWDGVIEVDAKDAVGLPLLAYAAWCDPDRAEQLAHFGASALSAESLGTYCLWRLALSEQEAAQWDAFLARIRPAEDAEARVRAFRFAGHETEESAPTGARAIADALARAQP